MQETHDFIELILYSPGRTRTASMVTFICVSRSINLVLVRRVINGPLEKKGLNIINGWNTVGKAMIAEGSDSDSLVLPSKEDAYVLVVEGFHFHESGEEGSTQVAWI